MAEGVKLTSEDGQAAIANMQTATVRIEASGDKLLQVTANTRSQGFTSDQASPAYEAAASKVVQKQAEMNKQLKKLREALGTTMDELTKTDQSLKQGATSISDKLDHSPAAAGVAAGGGAVAAGVAARSSRGTGSGGSQAKTGDAATAPSRGGMPPGGLGSSPNGPRSPVSDRDPAEIAGHIKQSNPNPTPNNCVYGTVAFANRYRGSWDKLITHETSTP